MREVIEKTWGWDEHWQQTEFARRISEYAVSVIEIDGEPAGALWLESTPERLHIVELQLLPATQGKGIGTAVVQRVIKQAANQGVPVTLSVVRANPRAKRLYERLGFEVCGHERPFIHMRHDAMNYPVPYVPPYGPPRNLAVGAPGLGFGCFPNPNGLALGRATTSSGPRLPSIVRGLPLEATRPNPNPRSFGMSRVAGHASVQNQRWTSASGSRILRCN